MGLRHVTGAVPFPESFGRSVASSRKRRLQLSGHFGRVYSGDGRTSRELYRKANFQVGGKPLLGGFLGVHWKIRRTAAPASWPESHPTYLPLRAGKTPDCPSAPPGTSLASGRARPDDSGAAPTGTPRARTALPARVVVEPAVRVPQGSQVGQLAEFGEDGAERPLPAVFIERGTAKRVPASHGHSCVVLIPEQKWRFSAWFPSFS